MAEPDVVAVDGRGHERSLRREWSRAFTIMLVFLLATAIATFVGLRQLVSEFSGTAHTLERVVVYREFKMAAFVEMLIFIALVFAGFLYVWKKGALDWSGEDPSIAKRPARRRA